MMPVWHHSSSCDDNIPPTRTCRGCSFWTQSTSQDNFDPTPTLVYYRSWYFLRPPSDSVCKNEMPAFLATHHSNADLRQSISWDYLMCSSPKAELQHSYCWKNGFLWFMGEDDSRFFAKTNTLLLELWVKYFVIFNNTMVHQITLPPPIVAAVGWSYQIDTSSLHKFYSIDIQFDSYILPLQLTPIL